jgi:hypothetical protein
MCNYAYNKSIYEILKRKKIIKADRLTFILIFSNRVIRWDSWFGLNSMDIYGIIMPDILRYISLLLVLSGIALFLTALLTIKTLEDYAGDLILQF